MNWNKIKFKAILETLREIDNTGLCLFGETSIIYSDGYEEVKITYKKLKDAKEVRE